MYAQRKGDIKSYALFTAESDKIKAQVLELQASTKTSQITGGKKHSDEGAALFDVRVHLPC